MNKAITSACLALVLCISSAQAGPAAQWQQRKPDFQAILVEYGHDGWCDWARFSVLTMMSYTAAKNEGRRRGWSSGQINALRHALWQYQLTHAFGDNVARAIGDQQEQYSTDPKDSAIDQYNNLQARILFRKYEQSGVPLDMAIRYIVRSIDREMGPFITRPGLSINLPSSPLSFSSLCAPCALW